MFGQAERIPRLGRRLILVTTGEHGESPLNIHEECTAMRTGRCRLQVSHLAAGGGGVREEGTTYTRAHTHLQTHTLGFVQVKLCVKRREKQEIHGKNQFLQFLGPIFLFI